MEPFHIAKSQTQKCTCLIPGADKQGAAAPAAGASTKQMPDSLRFARLTLNLSQWAIDGVTNERPLLGNYLRSVLTRANSIIFKRRTPKSKRVSDGSLAEPSQAKTSRAELTNTLTLGDNAEAEKGEKQQVTCHLRHSRF